MKNFNYKQYLKEGKLLKEEEFTSHGTYTISNAGGYEIMLSPDGEEAKVRETDGTISDWLPIVIDYDENEEVQSIIDPDGYNIDLNQVMRTDNGITDDDFENHLNEGRDAVCATCGEHGYDEDLDRPCSNCGDTEWSTDYEGLGKEFGEVYENEEEDDGIVSVNADWKDFGDFIEDLLVSLQGLGLYADWDPDLEDGDQVGILISKKPIPDGYSAWKDWKNPDESDDNDGPFKIGNWFDSEEVKDD